MRRDYCRNSATHSLLNVYNGEGLSLSSTNGNEVNPPRCGLNVDPSDLSLTDSGVLTACCKLKAVHLWAHSVLQHKFGVRQLVSHHNL